MTLRTRFAPSPTGFLHIGGARTALFCHLHTRRHGGTFILRIEDTDTERSTQEAVDVILEGLAWMGLSPDEGPFFQSDHTQRYLEVVDRMLAEGHAYVCTCSKERLDTVREEQRVRGDKPRYDGLCRELNLSRGAVPHVIRFKTPRDGEASWEDMIQGTIRFANDELDDLILVRSDGSPTYNLAVAVDDHDMGITLVIRGEDHISNTPRQMHLFRAMGWPIPEYAHMPLLHGSDGAKLSKRHGAVSVLQFREEGFLPDAINNYLVRLGWSHGEQEIFTMAELRRLFDVRELGRSAAIFDRAKLSWINGHHIRAATPEQLVPELAFQLGRLGIDPLPSHADLARILPEFQPRAATLVEMAQKCRFLFIDSVLPYEEKAARKHLTPAARTPLATLADHLASLGEWTVPAIDGVFQATLSAHGLTMGQLAQPLRVVLTGTAASPGIVETLWMLGPARCQARIGAGLAVLDGMG
ncbi:Glutamate--tRNA ligase [Candidatus Magnetaquicoccaceae bacterium FCR-1]|uniref:Glutamate--tRNA ligase n=1 Tax=Candidatus Magnetaquiglobus chichijimensis TaxID=3141448 RepID=A0ABQ0CA72_9PROT